MTSAEREQSIAYLRAARELLVEKFGQRYYASKLDSDGVLVDCSIDDPDACCYCAEGALAKVMGKTSMSSAFFCSHPLQTLQDAAWRTGQNVAYINDNVGKDAILAVFDQAIDKLESEVAALG